MFDAVMTLRWRRKFGPPIIVAVPTRVGKIGARHHFPVFETHLGILLFVHIGRVDSCETLAFSGDFVFGLVCIRHIDKKRRDVSR